MMLGYVDIMGIRIMYINLNYKCVLKKFQQYKTCFILVQCLVSGEVGEVDYDDEYDIPGFGHTIEREDRVVSENIPISDLLYN
jgi:hypothetical protein